MLPAFNHQFSILSTFSLATITTMPFAIAKSPISIIKSGYLLCEAAKRSNMPNAIGMGTHFFRSAILRNLAINFFRTRSVAKTKSAPTMIQKTPIIYNTLTQVCSACLYPGDDIVLSYRFFDVKYTIPSSKVTNINYINKLHEQGLRIYISCNYLYNNFEGMDYLIFDDSMDEYTD